MAKEVVVTIVTKSHEQGLLGLVKSLREIAGWDGPIEVYVPSDEVWDPPVPPPTRLIPVHPWWKDFWPTPLKSRDARLLKPSILDYQPDGAKVLFFDGGDILVYRNPKQIFDVLDETPLLFSPAQSGSKAEVVPGFEDLFGANRETMAYMNSGVWAVRSCPESRELFRMWKAFSAWGLAWGDSVDERGNQFDGGDMHTLNMAIEALHSQYQVLDRRWNWLPDYPVAAWGTADEKGHQCPLTTDGRFIFALHGAGTQAADYDRGYEALVGRKPKKMRLDKETKRWILV
jgi:hypothetical protein